ncbi:hypothetical protein [Paraclostridium sordellii]|uniref:hypothetical protein n=1 Tax=Paraclostridium sordellii TaxID=1505 RepID=UPI0005E260B8|nr:hypothetical protein [Paeniclostridium sordellii]CEP43726.1 Uncharacterised protein [[Clostridium] sordellii] [Paeniclostridium sordellii]CEP50466.1 Uncharacterised protein [[Clostridium] sordellii] [Paeniclostridium sordellii]
MKKSNLIKSFAMGIIASSMLITPAFADSCGYWTTITKYKRKCVNRNTQKHHWEYKTKQNHNHHICTLNK